MTNNVAFQKYKNSVIVKEVIVKNLLGLKSLKSNTRIPRKSKIIHKINIRHKPPLPYYTSVSQAEG